MSSPDWSPARLIVFRFGIVFGALLLYPFPIGGFTNTDWLAEYLNEPWNWGISWFAGHVFGIAAPNLGENGSGDSTWSYVQLLLIAIFATAGTIVWSTLDRGARGYRRLGAAAYLVLRYYVATIMLFYGIYKVLRLQYPGLSPIELDRRVADMSPMGLLWTFMDYSPAYVIFAGFAEALGGVLLLWRRTTVIGALVTIAAITNVMMMNYCYDVPGKLFTTELLVMAVILAVPDGRRLLAAVRGQAVAALPPRVRLAERSERARRITKALLIAGLAVAFYTTFSGWMYVRHNHELYGTWLVDSFVSDGVELPPTGGDASRWQKCLADRFTWAIVGGDGARQRLPSEIDAANQVIVVKRDATSREIWKYARPTPDQLVVDAIQDRKHLHVTMHREPDGRLVTRGFHWINDKPYNR